MKNFKRQNTCFLLCILIVDLVVYLLISLLFEGKDVWGIDSQTGLTVAMSVWHVVSLILLGYLASVSLKAFKGEKIPRTVKTNKTNLLRRSQKNIERKKSGH